MYSAARNRIGCLALAAAVAACPLVVGAQGFAADYGLRVATPASGSGVGLSMQAGRNWFGQVGLAQGPGVASTPGSTTEAVNVAGGYRWGNGQSLSLELSRGRGAGQRLGLAVNYDWPRYFVRFAYDPGMNVVPQDGFRFSAGMRF